MLALINSFLHGHDGSRENRKEAAPSKVMSSWISQSNSGFTPRFRLCWYRHNAVCKCTDSISCPCASHCCPAGTSYVVRKKNTCKGSKLQYRDWAPSKASKKISCSEIFLLSFLEDHSILTKKFSWVSCLVLDANLILYTHIRCYM